MRACTPAHRASCSARIWIPCATLANTMACSAWSPRSNAYMHSTRAASGSMSPSKWLASQTRKVCASRRRCSVAAPSRARLTWRCSTRLIATASACAMRCASLVWIRRRCHAPRVVPNKLLPTWSFTSNRARCWRRKVWRSVWSLRSTVSTASSSRFTALPGTQVRCR